jgi:hypothetical protein
VGRSLVNIPTIKPPKKLIQFLDDPPLVGNEKAEDYYDLFAVIVEGTKPRDAIDWLHVKCLVDLTWEIRRERAIKAGIVELMRKEIVLDLLKSTRGDSASLDTHMYRIFDAAGEANKWASDPQAQKEIDTKLAACGYPAADILVRAYMKGAGQIDAVDRRIASYEVRRMVVLREIERRNDKLARQLENASSKMIDADFSEAAE